MSIDQLIVCILCVKTFTRYLLQMRHITNSSIDTCLPSIWIICLLQSCIFIKKASYESVLVWLTLSSIDKYVSMNCSLLSSKHEIIHDYSSWFNMLVISRFLPESWMNICIKSDDVWKRA